MDSEKLTVSYSRVSSISQNLDRQTYGIGQVDREYTDKCSGMVRFSERMSGKRLIDDCEKGIIKEVIFYEISRIGRDMINTLETLNYFANKQIQVRVVREGITLLDETGKLNPTAQILIGVLTSIASIERTSIRERQREGIAIAKVKGKYLGRRKGSVESVEQFISKPKHQKALRLLREQKYKKYEIGKIVGLSNTTVTKIARLA